MTQERTVAVIVEHHDGQTVTTLHLTSVDEETKLRQIADDLGLVIDDHGFTQEEPDIRRITIRR